MAMQKKYFRINCIDQTELETVFELFFIFKEQVSVM